MKGLAWFVSGLVLASLGFLVFSGAAFYPAQNELVEKWQLIDVGMTTEEVTQVLGKPFQTYGAGELPNWATENVSPEYVESHGVITCTIGTIGPNILLIFFDENQKVTFVGSTST